MTSDRGKGEATQARAGGQEQTLKAHRILPKAFSTQALAYPQQVIKELHLILAPGLRLVPHKLHQSCRQDEKHGELGWGPGFGSCCRQTGLSLSSHALLPKMHVSQAEQSSLLFTDEETGLREVPWAPEAAYST